MKSLSLLRLVPFLIFISCNTEEGSLYTMDTHTNPTSELDKALEYLEMYKIDSAEHLFKTITNENTQQHYPGIYAKALLNLGRIESDRGENVKALQHYQNAMRIAERINDTDIIPYIEKNIGVLYVQWKKFDQAIDYYNRAAESAQKIDNEELLADCRNNMGIVYEQKGDYDKALIAYREALSHYNAKNIQGKIAMAYSNMAIVFKLQKQYRQSVEYNLKAVEIFEKIQDKWSMAATYNNIGNLLGETGNYLKAIAYCQQSLSIATEIKAEEIIGMAYESMAEAAAIAKDFEKAYAYHKQYLQSTKKFINEENTRQLSELSIKYETEKKEKQLIETTLVSRQKDIGIILLCGSILIGIVVFRNFRVSAFQKQKQLSLENDLLKEQTQSRMQQQRLEISRDLHDSLGAQLTLIHSISDGLKNTSAQWDASNRQKIQTLSEFSENAMAELRNTLWVLHSKEIYLTDLKNKILNFIQSASEAREQVQFIIDFQLIETATIHSKPAVNVFRALQEIVNNALKYSDASEIKVAAHQHENKLTLTIADNGRGFDYEREQYKSYGLQNIKTRLESLKGTISVVSEINKGTIYTLQIAL